jgi:hypothetical protein
VCRLDWTDAAVRWRIARFKADDGERTATIARLADRACLAAAFDGPLRSDLEVIGRYRLAERMLTIGLGPMIGKPGQASAPIGKLLNHHANLCARAVLDGGVLGAAAHKTAIHDRAVVEAFPTSFAGVLIVEPDKLEARRGDRSDTFYKHLVASGGIESLIGHLLPGRSVQDLNDVSNHDDRAGLLCALTALCIAADDYTAVGEAGDGWIILPPRSLIQPWAWSLLEINHRRFGGLFSTH